MAVFCAGRKCRGRGFFGGCCSYSSPAISPPWLTTPPTPSLPPHSFIILKYMDLITIAVPPALPACLTVATAIAVARLQVRQGAVTGRWAIESCGGADLEQLSRRFSWHVSFTHHVPSPPTIPLCPLQTHDIFVSNPSAVALAGHLNVLCFDKTGTLTEPGLDLQVRGAVVRGVAVLEQHSVWMVLAYRLAGGLWLRQHTLQQVGTFLIVLYAPFRSTFAGCGAGAAGRRRLWRHVRRRGAAGGVPGAAGHVPRPGAAGAGAGGRPAGPAPV